MKTKSYIILMVFVLLAAAMLFSNASFFYKNLNQKPLANKSLPDLAGGPEAEVRGYPQRKVLDLTSMFPGLVFNSGPRGEKFVALTFDDGPDNVFTPQILDVLKAKKVRATFFIIGSRAETLPDMMARIVNEGHVIGNHTWTHANLIKLSNDEFYNEINKTNVLLNKISGRKTSLFRSPYGSIDPSQVNLVGGLNMKIIAWNVDSLDWKGLPESQVKSNILENVRKGSIILQHAAGGSLEDLSGTVQALPTVIDVLQKEGYKFLTIPELLKI